MSAACYPHKPLIPTPPITQLLSFFRNALGDFNIKFKIANHFGEPDRFEAGCNPIVQAEILNSGNLDLHIIVGLCIGHDLLFTMFSKAPVTTLIVKDRVTGHNPFASLFSGYHNPRYFTEKTE